MRVVLTFIVVYKYAAYTIPFNALIHFMTFQSFMEMLSLSQVSLSTCWVRIFCYFLKIAFYWKRLLS